MKTTQQSQLDISSLCISFERVNAFKSSVLSPRACHFHSKIKNKSSGGSCVKIRRQGYNFSHKTIQKLLCWALLTKLIYCEFITLRLSTDVGPSCGERTLAPASPFLLFRFPVVVERPYSSICLYNHKIIELIYLFLGSSKILVTNNCWQALSLQWF